MFKGNELTGTYDITGKQIVTFLRYALFVTGVAVFAGGTFLTNWNLMFWGMFLLFLSNLFFGFDKGSIRFIFLFFHLAVFTFLIVRPFMLVVQGKEWVWYSKDATWAALMMVFLSLLAMRFGAIIGEGILARSEVTGRAEPDREKSEYQKAFRESLAIVSLIIFIILIAASFAEGFEKLAFMQDKSYNDYFLSYESSLPGAVLAMASMAKYVMCVFLATLPRKRVAALVLLIYLLDAVPWFIIGVRNPVILRVIFIIIYFIFRDVLKKQANGGRPVRRKWIGKLEKTLIIVGTPVLIIVMGVYSKIRVDREVNSGILGSIGDFFYAQGTSFDTIRAVHDVIPQLPGGPKNYTFGPITDYLVHGSIGQRLFGTIDLGNTNSAVKAIYGSNLAHSSMYTTSRDLYLQGWGQGSSYVLENYVDWGFVGVIVFSLILGALLILLFLMMKKDNTLLRTIAFVSLLGLFFSPRAEALDWLTFLVYIQFWVLIIVVYVLAGLCARTYSHKLKGGLTSST